MSISIPAVNTATIEHVMFVEIDLNDNGHVPTYFSTGSSIIVYNGNTYWPLGGFLGITDIVNNIQNSVDEITLSLSGIPSGYIGAVLGNNIKGGQLKILRAFIDSTTGLVKVTGGTPEVYTRFVGQINNFAVQEDFQPAALNSAITYTISIMAANIFGLFEKKYAGRRTNPTDYKINWGERFFTTAIATDPSMDHVQALFNASFDFGKPYRATTGNTPSESPGGQDTPQEIQF
jgi:hypothetical protein